MSGGEFDLDAYEAAVLGGIERGFDRRAELALVAEVRRLRAQVPHPMTVTGVDYIPFDPSAYEDE